MAKYVLVLIPGVLSVVLAGMVSPGENGEGLATLALLLVILGTIAAGVVGGIQVFRWMKAGTGVKVIASLTAFLAVGIAYFGACYGGCLLVS